MCAMGVDVEQNNADALEFYRLAHAAGHPEAIYRLRSLADAAGNLEALDTYIAGLTEASSEILTLSLADPEAS